MDGTELDSRYVGSNEEMRSSGSFSEQTKIHITEIQSGKYTDVNRSIWGYNQ